MNEQLVHHYPPELFDLLVEAIARLLKGKQSLLTFFKGCGVEPRVYDDIQQVIYRDKDSITKFEIVRRILTCLNDLGDNALRARREVLKRVTQWEDFTSCYEKDRAAAEGYVARIQRVVNVKDSFTRMRQAQERAQSEVRSKRDTEIAAVQQLKKDREQVRLDLVELCQEADASKRGKALEAVLNRFFALEGVLVREAFKRIGVAGEGVVEQIDGVVALDGTTFLVEMKWWAKQLGVNEVAPHLVRVYGRSDVAGIIISSSGFTEPAVTQCREALAQKTVVLMTLAEIVRLLERSGALLELLRKKIQAARLDKNPMHEVVA